MLWFGASRVMSGNLTPGELLMLLSYLGSLYKPVKSLSKLSQVVSKGAAAAERISDIMATPPDIADRPGARDPDPWQRRAAQRHVLVRP